tara:strand:+ start:3082 stop:3306 length:225 start_codon:yes stop_codon:yes gene_type:complete
MVRTMENDIEREMRMALGLVWQGLYDCQDEDSIMRGDRYEDYFMVWRKGTAYRVKLEWDFNMNAEPEEILEEEE